AEDGIRDFHVTGVQTCALPIYDRNDCLVHHASPKKRHRRGSPLLKHTDWPPAPKTWTFGGGSAVDHSGPCQRPSGTTSRGFGATACLPNRGQRGVQV